MEYTVKQLAQLAGVTARTLRWYDREGLLKPLRATEAGYRIYGPHEVDRLQQILCYRELGLELRAIRAILEDPDFDREAALQSHLAQLECHRAQLDTLILTVQKTIQSQRGDFIMSDQEKFEGLKREATAENERKYGAELRKQYGDKTIEASNQKFGNLTPEQYEAMQALDAEIRKKLERAVKAGEDPAGPEGTALAELHRQWLSYTWPSYTKEAHRGLAKMYVDDARFTAYYDKNVPGCAQFLRNAIVVACA